MCIYLQTLPFFLPLNPQQQQGKTPAKEPRVQVSQGLSQTPATGLWAYIEKAASIMLGVKKEDDGPLLQDSNGGGGGLGGGGGSSKSRVDAKGLKSEKTHVKHQGEDDDGASSSSSTSSSSSDATAAVAAANSSTATAAGSSSSASSSNGGYPVGGTDDKKKCGKRSAKHALPHWVGTSFNECSKRARRPPPRFTESGLDSKEESILRQAIENSKIETHLCDTVEISEVPTFR